MANRLARKQPPSFHTEDVWPTITALCRKGRGHVAVAFLGAGSYDLLPLSEGSILVVNASLDAVRQGLTNPSELIKFVKKKVKVHTAQDLHAKVFAFPHRVVIGSANASKSSARYWQEAAVASSERAIIEGAHEFVRRMCGQRLTLAELRALEGEAPKRAPKLLGQGGVRKDGPDRAPLWVTRIVRGAWDAETTALASRVRPAAKARLEDGDTLDTFSWPRRGAAGFQPGHQVVEILEEGDRILVYPPATILVPPAETAKGKGATSVVFTGRPKDQSALELKKAQRALGRHREVLGIKKAMHLVSSRAAAQALRQLWSDQ